MSVAVAVLGLGSIGTRHARNLMALGCDVIGYDPSETCRRSLEDNGGRAVQSRDEAMDGAAAVAICSPNGHHLEDLVAAVGRGKPIFIEKPLAHTDVGLDDILADAEQKHVPVSVGFNLRHHPAVRRAHEIIAGGTLGPPLWGRFICGSYLPSWRPAQDYRRGYAADPRTGGVIFDIIHEFDLAHFLLGPATPIAATARRTGRIEIEAEDCADALLRHANGVTSAVHVDYVTRPGIRISEIALAGGFARINLDGRRLLVQDAAGKTVSDELFPGDDAQDYVAEMRQFLSSLNGGVQPACDGREGLAVLRTVLAVRRMAGLPE